MLLGDRYEELLSPLSKVGMGIKSSPHPRSPLSPIMYLHIHMNWSIFICNMLEYCDLCSIVH
jgi:hypothetical protein